MTIYNVKQWKEDIEEIIEALPELENLAGNSVLVTGATGLICSAVVDVLIRWNEIHDKKIRILAAGRSEEKIIRRYTSYVTQPWFVFVPYDALRINNKISQHMDYIIHGASNASPNHIVAEPVETMISNFIGMKYLLDLAKEKGTKRVVYISSSEVYGRKDSNKPFGTSDYGWIDLLNPRSSYPIGKCAAETLCVSYFVEYNVDSSIIRPGHIYGPTAGVDDNRVSSTWAHAAAKGDNIVMKSDGCQIRSYCYCLDSAAAIIKVLLKGESVRAYNISNPNSVITIRQMAELLAKSAGVELQYNNPTEMERKGFNPMSNSSLDSSELSALGWKGLFNAERGVSHTVEILKQM